MFKIDACINDIYTAARSGRSVIDIRGRSRGLVGDTAQTPRSTTLGGDSGGSHDSVLLNICDL